MNKAEFMRDLEGLLWDVPYSEKVEALKYYEEYFNDAGEENEQMVLAELGSPQRVANTIKQGMTGSICQNPYQNQGAYQNAYQGAPTEQHKEGLPTWAIVLIVIGCIFGSPLILGVLAALFGVIMGIFGVVIGFFGAGAGLLAGGMATIVAGALCLVELPLTGVGVMGVGMILMAVGLVFLMGAVWLCGVAIPAICRGIAWLFKKLKSSIKS